MHAEGEHRAILDAIRAGDASLAEERMKAHLEGVRDIIQKWSPERSPVPSE
ncbi:FCD domain-containing protein [Salinibacter grassmerensis]|uniref:FCD domain-containing protein n=1 Tax=Salinibacter grassmerensis TaxID=3040353 RepID=UPI003C6DB9F9